MTLPFAASLTLVLLTLCCRAGELRTLTLNSGRPGPVLVVVAPEGGAGACGLDAVRQLQYRTPTAGALILAEAVTDFSNRDVPKGWSRSPDVADLDRSYPGHHTLIFREDNDSRAYTPLAKGDTVAGDGAAAAAVLASLKRLPPLDGLEWTPLPGDGDTHKTCVTTNAREHSESGFRPARRQREFRHAAYGLLRHLGMISGWKETDVLFPEKQEGRIRVAMYDDGGALSPSARRPEWIRASLSRYPDFAVELVGAPEIREGALARADVLIMGGGKTNLQNKALEEEGREAIRRYVRGGGNYLGICAGAYLGATTHIGKDPSKKYARLELLPVETRDTETHMETPLAWEANPTGPAKNENADLSGGPRFFIPEKTGDIRVWARFVRDETYEGIKNELKGLPAVISGNYGAGKVLLLSTHCERRPTFPAFLPDALRWCASREN